MSSKMLEWYKVVILSTQPSGIAKIADSFLGVILSINNNEYSNKYLSVNVLVFLITALEGSNLFYIIYKYTSLKYGLFKYYALIFFTVTCMYVPFCTFLYIILNILSKSAYLGKTCLLFFFCYQLVCVIQVNPVCSFPGL